MTETVNLPGDFIQGMVRYSDAYPDNPGSRIVVGVTLGNGVSLTHAIIDTGAPWCIFGPKWVEAVGIDYQQNFQERPFWVRGDKYQGWLCRMAIGLEAEKGESLTVDATVFVPKLEDQEWRHPNFIGLSGFLERIRFAIDPDNNYFYFGALDGG